MKTKPRINHGDLTTPLLVRVTPKLMASLDVLAARNGWSRSEAVRKILTRQLLESASPVHIRPAGRFSSPTRLRDAIEQLAIINPHYEGSK